MTGRSIHVSGVVQGVGFRPFVYGLASQLGLTGRVWNTSAGVDIELDGSEAALADFSRALCQSAPPLAKIDQVDVRERAANGYHSFEIVESEPIPGAFQPVSPDVAICPDCLRELFDPSDRRYRYPFINCTNCGPRFTIIEDIPYDRPKTTMAGFRMCPECEAEYGNPLDRRFHAQPIACPKCGPRVWLEANGGVLARDDEALTASQELLGRGKIVAVKGLGGFHLACDATNAAAVAELRRSKLRVDKAFALMLPGIDAVLQHCYVSPQEKELLESRERPIVILKRRPGSTIADEVAPGQDTLGVMLPYTPLHYLLLSGGKPALTLVMTSGNLSEEPIAVENDEARERLAELADAFLLHDRGIRTRCDDSVVRVFPVTSIAGDHSAQVYPLRRSRGYSPFPVRLPFDVPPLLAAGGELKNTFCVARERYAFLSHHIGDLENYETLRSFEDGIAHFERLFRIEPELVAYDLHPNYMASRYAVERAAREGIRAIGVQHHHAHVAACMAEHGLTGERPVIGVAFDGTGFGDDGAIWGGEFLLADHRGYRRPFHLDYLPMAGGDRAVREPWRLALAWLRKAGIEWEQDLPPVQAATADKRRVLERQIEQGINAPLTSSIGRLFDAVSALVGIRQSVNYEAQAAIELEALADPAATGEYEFLIRDDVVDPAPALRAIVADLRAGVPVSTISTRFHNGVARMVRNVCGILRANAGLNEVALSGGVWQNLALLERAVKGLQEDDFVVYTHRLVPANDGGLALGQAVVAASIAKK